jgi:hypothetical protein
VLISRLSGKSIFQRSSMPTFCSASSCSFGQALHQVRRHIEVPGTQCLLHRLIQQPWPRTSGRHADAARQRLAGLPAAQQVGEQVVIAEPAPMLVERHQEHLMGLQVAQDCALSWRSRTASHSSAQKRSWQAVSYRNACTSRAGCR